MWYPCHDTSCKLGLAQPPCLFLTAHKQQPFHTHTFQKPSDLIDILHSNYHVLWHRYNCIAGALLVYLAICDKCILVNITQAFCFLFKDLLSVYVIDIPGILTASLHTSVLSGWYISAIFLKASLNGTTSATLYTRN